MLVPKRKSRRLEAIRGGYHFRHLAKMIPPPSNKSLMGNSPIIPIF